MTIVVESDSEAGSLAGRRFLLFAVRFFGYEREIVAELERRGATVDFLPDRPFDTPLMTAVTRYARPAIMPSVYRFYRRALRALGDKDYTDVMVINGQTMPRRLLEELRAELPRARFTFYIWDSMRNKPGTAAILPLFDDCSTFDPEAAQTYGMRLRPLFFVPAFDRPANQDAAQWDVSFIGTVHTDRFRIIDHIDRALGPDVTRYWYLFLKAPWVYWAHRLTNSGFKGARRSQFSFVPMPGDQVRSVFAGSRAVIDIEHPHQTGLTMRTFETLGAGKKLITTNAGVRDCDFYDPANIHVIDRANPVVPPDFLHAPYQPVPLAIRERYSLAGWLDEVLQLGRATKR